MASTSEAGIYELPNEILVSIFSFLPVADLGRCAAVCEQWHEIVTGFTHLWKGKCYVSKSSPREGAETRNVLLALPPFQEVVIETADEFAVDIAYPRLVLKVTCIGEAKGCPRMRCESLSTGADVAGGILSYRSTVDFEALGKLRILRTQTPDSWATTTYSATYVVGTALGLCPNLTQLSVCADSLSADDLDTVEGFRQLRALEIECPGLEKLAFLRHCSGTLEKLQLGGCTGLPSQEFAELRRLRNLRRLRLSDCQFAESDLAAAAAGLGSLEVLQLNRCGRVRDLSILQHCGHLRELCVTNSQVPDALLSVTPSGRQLQLRNLRLPADAEVIPVRAVGVILTVDDLSAALPTLEDLGLASSCVAYLAALRRCPQLRHLCCEFVRQPDEPELLNVRVRMNISSS